MSIFYLLKGILKITFCDTSSRVQARPTSTLPLPENLEDWKQMKLWRFVYALYLFNECLMIFGFMRKRSGVCFYRGDHTFMTATKNDQFYDFPSLSGELVLLLFKNLILVLHYISVVFKNIATIFAFAWNA